MKRKGKGKGGKREYEDSVDGCVGQFFFQSPEVDHKLGCQSEFVLTGDFIPRTQRGKRKKRKRRRKKKKRRKGGKEEIKRRKRKGKEGKREYEDSIDGCVGRFCFQSPEVDHKLGCQSEFVSTGDFTTNSDWCQAEFVVAGESDVKPSF